mgnify:CR=1 FL=1
MQHTAGNYEAFARPRPARHAQETKAYIVGSGLAGASTCAERRRAGPLRFTCSSQSRSDSAISRSSGQDGRSMAAL